MDKLLPVNSVIRMPTEVALKWLIISWYNLTFQKQAGLDQIQTRNEKTC